MSGIDVQELAKESLPAGRFPVSSRAPFRLYLAPEAHRAMRVHAQQDVSVEICGVLVGRWERDDDGPYALVTNHIRCDSASSKFAEVTFTHESWSQINHEMDTRFANERIIGWYHSHPDFGIFLSDRDRFIHQHFFSGPGQVAYVIDPIRDLEGVFAWQDGAPTPLSHYWIGDKICTVAASERPPAGKTSSSAQQPAGEDSSLAQIPTRRQSSLDLAATILSWLALFLLGYLLAGMKSNWERRMIVEGTVAHFGFDNLAKIGLEQNLAQVRERLALVGAAFAELPTTTDGLSENELQNVESRRALIAQNLLILEQALSAIEQVYGLSDDQRDAVMRVVAQKHSELQQLAEANAAARKKAKADESADTKPVSDAASKSAAAVPSQSPSLPAKAPAASNPNTTPVGQSIEDQN